MEQVPERKSLERTDLINLSASMLDESVLQSKATTAQIDEAEKFYNCATGMNPFAWIYVVYQMIVT